MEATGLGARTLVINDGFIGGTCVNVGCVPSKYFLKMSNFGYSFDTVRRNLPNIVSNMRRKKYEELIDIYGFDYVSGKARFVSESEIEVNGEVIRGKGFIIATGSRPSIPPIKGLKNVDYHTNLSIFNLEELPKKLIILGGGYIGVELAQSFRRFGSEVVIIEVGEHILPQEDEDVAEVLTEVFKNEGIDILTNTKVYEISSHKDGIIVKCERDGEMREISGSHILVATGRGGNTDGLGIEELGIKTDSCGYIITDDTLRTNIENIYAAGDVNGKYPFVYVAAREGKIAARNLILNGNEKVDYRCVPYVIFTDPQIAGVGVGEKFLKSLDIDYRKGYLEFKDIPIGELINYEHGFIKILVSHNDKIIGARIVGKNAGEMINILTLAIKENLTYKSIQDMFIPFLTFTEGVRMASLRVDKTKPLSCCAG